MSVLRAFSCNRSDTQPRQSEANRPTLISGNESCRTESATTLTLPLQALVPYEHNARTHSPEQIGKCRQIITHMNAEDPQTFACGSSVMENGAVLGSNFDWFGFFLIGIPNGNLLCYSFG